VPGLPVQTAGSVAQTTEEARIAAAELAAAVTAAAEQKSRPGCLEAQS